MNKLVEMWRFKKPTFGPFVQLPAAGIPEILALAGMDFYIIDLEHGPINIETAENMVRGGEAKGIVPIVRVLANKPELIAQALNIGAVGVHVPLIKTKKDAEEAVKSSRFFPLGDRGVCPFVKAAKYGSDKNNYYTRSNEDTIVILGIEGVDGIANLDEILSVKGIDVIFVGPYDLSQSLGIPGKVLDPIVIKKVKEICNKANKQGIVVGVFVDQDVNTMKNWIKQGVLYCCLEVDSTLLYKSFKKHMDQLKT